MKNLIKNTNPFVLLVLPVMLAIVMGLGYQVKQSHISMPNAAYSTTKATSLFNKSITLFKAVCSVRKQNVW